MSDSSYRREQRPGAASVEFAITLPLLVMLLLGSVELGRAVMVQHKLQEVAYAGCRLYSVQEADQADAERVIDEALSFVGITDYTITFNPESKQEITQNLQPVSVEVSVAFENTAWIAPSYLVDSNITARCTLPADIGDSAADDGIYNLSDDDNVFDGVERVDDPPISGDDDD